MKDFTNAPCFETDIVMNLHTGTHIDRPLHMIEGGETMDSLDISNLVTECVVLDFSHLEEKITKADLVEKEIQRGTFVILKTKNSNENVFNPSFVYLEESGAKYLQSLAVKGVGIDALGIERAQLGYPTHKTILGDMRIILEGLVLKGVQEGKYQLIALPLKIAGVEASPTRAILIQE